MGQTPPPSLGQNPNFYQKFVLEASLNEIFNNFFPVPETCRPLLHNLTTLHLQQGWNNLAEAVSATKKSSFLSNIHTGSSTGEYTTLTTLDTASYPGYPLRSSPPRYQSEPPFSLSSPSFYTSPTVTQVATSFFLLKHLLSRQLAQDHIPIPSYSLVTTTSHGFTTTPLPSPRYLKLTS